MKSRSILNRRLRNSLRFVVVIVILWFVGQRAVSLWSSAGDGSLADAAWGWIVASAPLYALSWLPAGLFWWQVLNACGSRVPLFMALRAYYCGHLGKYVPGKALPFVIRAEMVSTVAPSRTVTAMCVAAETLAAMGFGLVLGAALAPWMAPSPDVVPVSIRWIVRSPVAVSVGLMLLTAVLLPIGSRLLTMVASRRAGSADDDTLRVPTRILAVGLLGIGGGWCLQGGTLWCVLRCLGVETAPNLLALTAAIALATSIGFFFILVPGGLGVREEILFELLRLQPGISGQQAVAAALLMRAIALVVESIVAAALYAAGPNPMKTSDPSPSD